MANSVRPESVRLDYLGLAKAGAARVLREVSITNNGNTIHRGAYRPSSKPNADAFEKTALVKAPARESVRMAGPRALKALPKLREVAMDATLARPEVKLGLRQEGRLLLDPYGREVRLQGINAGGGSKFPPLLSFRV